MSRLESDAAVVKKKMKDSKSLQALDEYAFTKSLLPKVKKIKIKLTLEVVEI